MDIEYRPGADLKCGEYSLSEARNGGWVLTRMPPRLGQCSERIAAYTSTEDMLVGLAETLKSKDA